MLARETGALGPEGELVTLRIWPSLKGSSSSPASGLGDIETGS